MSAPGSFPIEDGKSFAGSNTCDNVDAWKRQYRKTSAGGKRRSHIRSTHVR